MKFAKKVPLLTLIIFLIFSMPYFAVAQDTPQSGLDNDPIALLPSSSAVVGSIIFTPDSIALAPGDISPVLGLATKTFTTEYNAFGVVFSTNTAGDTVPTAVFIDPPHAWGGVNSSGYVDLLTPVIGEIVIPGTSNPTTASFLRVEAGLAAVGNLLLEVFDSSGNLIGSTINDDGIGSHDRTLMILSVPGIRSFRISSPNEDTFGVDEIQLGVPRVPPVGGELVQPYTLTFPLPWTALAVATTLVTVTLFLGRRRKLI